MVGFNQKNTGTIHIAALLSATDRDGEVDPMAYEAQRLILQHQRLGSIDADGLVRDLQGTLGFEIFDRDTFLQSIDARLDTLAEKKRFAEALDTANITDTRLERAGEFAGEVIGGAYDVAKDGVEWGDRYLTGKMSWSYQWAERSINAPDANPLEREAALAAREAVGKAQELYGTGRGGFVHALDMVDDTVNLAKLGYRFTTDENFRNLLIGTAKLYAAETMDDPGKPARDVRNAAFNALERWEDGLTKAKADGREQQYLGETTGAVGVELAATLVPVSKMAKFGKLAGALDADTPDALVEMATLAGDAQRAIARAEAAPPLSTAGPASGSVNSDQLQLPGRLPSSKGIDIPDVPGLPDLQGPRGVLSSGRLAAEAGEQILDAQIRLYRDAGKLDQLIDAAHKTGNVEGLLRSGELSPKELAEIAKKDVSIFEGKVGFREAVGISVDGVNLATLSKRQLGDIGEALHTFDLIEKGHTDIMSIKNASGHGIDVISRDPTGTLQFDEVKTSAQGQAKAQRGDPEDFVIKRIERAIGQEKHWAERNTMPGLREVVEKIRDDIIDPNTNELRQNLNTKWVQINLSHSSGSPKLDVEKTVADWVEPEIKKQRLLEPLSQDHQALHQGILEKGLDQGLDKERAQNLAAQGLLTFMNDPLTSRADYVGIHDERLFIIYFPFGHGTDPNHYVNLKVDVAAQTPAHETLQQVAKLDQQQTQERIAQLQAPQQEGPDGPKGPTIGPRTV